MLEITLAVHPRYMVWNPLESSSSNGFECLGVCLLDQCLCFLKHLLATQFQP